MILRTFIMTQVELATTIQYKISSKDLMCLAIPYIKEILSIMVHKIQELMKIVKSSDTFPFMILQ